MDPKRFRAPYIPRERIWQEADRLRAKFASGAKIPVNVLDMAEFDLGLEIVPADGLRERCDTEALLHHVHLVRLSGTILAENRAQSIGA